MTLGGDDWLLGLMSGTSMDGIDAALIKSDGSRVLEQGPRITLPYDASQRALLESVMGNTADCQEVETALTHWHHQAVSSLLEQAGLKASDVSLIGFHGQTTFHDPKKAVTRQIGDGALLAKLCGIAVVNDFRSADVAAGGEGAPLAPLYHRALAKDLEKPLMVLNIGGVSNITFLGQDETVLACDTGPGNGLLDDWMMKHFDMPMDEGGKVAASGTLDPLVLAGLLDHGYFSEAPPKSLDRYDFSPELVQALNPMDGATTLTAFTAAAVAKVLPFLPERPNRCLVTGGGRRNPFMMDLLTRELDMPVEPVEVVGWDGDALEAQAFAFLARRSQLGLPLSLPTTTRVAAPCKGGVLHLAS
ncbi:anhydro-N-acetylmuramic acid kinase [Kiloniella laminariae]|uniref:Anhydro-N-acetylmuramic acid kinase n=2 Tax=Kiloniella laminariae TaxID=454162 RepID=A0ABT4LGI4_9PROT|nr:anhydro-N-acetylmuramic acid kinase [Kiloniella laminariae]MCZ4279451.1 anhydro-N-acetylmuramic acid kinase [Kiloniella laminariae]